MSTTAASESSQDNAALPFGKALLAGAWDSKNVDAFVDSFEADAEWIVNLGDPPVVGHEAIQATTRAFQSTSKASRHFGLQGVESARTFVVHGAVEYSYEDKPNITCRFCDIFEMNSDRTKIVKCYTYMDTAPLM